MEAERADLVQHGYDRWFVAPLAERGPVPSEGFQLRPGDRVLHPDVTVGDAADLLWVLTSFDSFDLLYTGRGRPVESVADALIATAERGLCREGLLLDGKTPCPGRAGEASSR